MARCSQSAAVVTARPPSFLCTACQHPSFRSSAFCCCCSAYPRPHHPACSPLSRVFKVVWAAWRARRSGTAANGGSGESGGGSTEPLLLNGPSGNGSAHGGSLYPPTADGGANGGLANGAGGGLGRRTASLQWLNAAAESRVAGALSGAWDLAAATLACLPACLPGDCSLSSSPNPHPHIHLSRPPAPPIDSPLRCAALPCTPCTALQAARGASRSARWRRSSWCCACCPSLAPPCSTGQSTCRQARAQAGWGGGCARGFAGERGQLPLQLLVLLPSLLLCSP